MPRKKKAETPVSTPPSRAPVLALWVAVPLVIAGLMWYYLRLSRAAAGEVGFPLDDSWIHVRFAQNLAAGGGFSFNPGVPTSTTTSVLWTLLLAACYRVTHEYLYTSMVVNWALCVGVCVLVYHLSLTLNQSRWLALAAAGVTAVTVPLPWWALSGMEPALYAGLALLGMLLHLGRRGGREEGRKGGGGFAREVAPTVVMALAGLARPELLLLFPLAMVDRLWREEGRRGGREEGRWLRELAVHVPVFLVIVAPQFLYNYQVTGYWLPTSFYSKALPTSLSRAAARGEWGVIFANPFQEWWALVKMWAGNNAVLIAPFFVGLWLAVRGRRSLFIPLVLVLQPAVWAVLGGFRDPAYQSQRYVANLNPLFILLGMYGLWWITERVGARRSAGVRGALVMAALAFSLAQQPEAAKTYARNVKDITEMQVTIARWLRATAPKGSLLAVNDVGAVGVIADNPVLDLQGLVTPEALAARAEGLKQYEEFKQGRRAEPPTAMSDFVFSRRPDYLVIFPQWYPEMDARRDLLTPVFWVELQDNITAGAPVMVVYRTVWAEEKQ